MQSLQNFIIGVTIGATVTCPALAPGLAPFLASSFTGYHFAGLTGAAGAKAIILLGTGVWNMVGPQPAHDGYIQYGRR
jgi:hypothetical protein